MYLSFFTASYFSTVMSTNHHFSVGCVIFKSKIVNMIKVNNPSLIKIAISNGYISVIVFFCLGVFNLTKESDSRTAIGIWEAAIFDKKVIYGT